RLLDAGAQTIASGDVQPWRQEWGTLEGDDARTMRWPNRANLGAENHPADDYRIDSKADLAYGATEVTGDAPLGSDLAPLPPAAPNGAARASDRARATMVRPDSEDGVPKSRAEPAPYSGEKIALGAPRDPPFDLGLHLKTVQRTQRFAERVVLHLVNGGDKT